MTAHRGLDIKQELAQVLTQLNQCIEAEQQQARDMGVNPTKLRDSDGNLVMTPLLVAKAQVLHALVLANQ